MDEGAMERLGTIEEGKSNGQREKTQRSNEDELISHNATTASLK